MASIPGLGRSSGGGHGNPFQYSWGKIPGTEDPGSPWGHKELDKTEATEKLQSSLYKPSNKEGLTGR